VTVCGIIRDWKFQAARVFLEVHDCYLLLVCYHYSLLDLTSFLIPSI
jgi:hypothetical protein